MKDCELIRDLMPLYADGQASPASRRSIEEHTTHCPACKKLLDEMCAPLEPEPEDRAEEILAAWAKKHRRKKLRTAGIVALCLVLALWGLLEVRYNGTLVYPVEVSKERIMKKIPELALTEAELALADTLMETPEVLDAFNANSQDGINLEPDLAEQLLAPILPEDSKIMEVFVFGRLFFATYRTDTLYVVLNYGDGDASGHIDGITKSIIEYPKGFDRDSNPIGNHNGTYDAFYAVGTGFCRYQQLKSRHIWFGFLDFLTED